MNNINTTKLITQNNIEKLEFNIIQQLLSKFCINTGAKNLALNLKPTNNKYIAVDLLNETTEALNLTLKAGEPIISEILHIQNQLDVIKANGTLSIKNILELTNIFKLSSSLKSYFQETYITSEDFPILSQIFNKLYSNQNIISEVNKCILDSQTLSNDASSELYRLRMIKRQLEVKIKDTLNKLIHSQNYSKYIQESIVTIRNDRFVIPIKEEFRGQIKGFIHDISNAGSTLFIEPLSIFELNNELNEIKIKEQLEIEKILTSLTTLFYPYILELKQDFDLINYLDFVFAKAKYSKMIKGVHPTINTEKQIDLINARHPLINPRISCSNIY